MSKVKTKYICSNCGYESLTWLGKCPNCGEWDSFSEERIESNKNKSSAGFTSSQAYPLIHTNDFEESRIVTGIKEFDRVLGGGIMPGSAVLIGGDPGIGKSTLALQVAASVNKKVLYVTGEESAKQLTQRAGRLKIESNNVLVLPETNVNAIVDQINKIEPEIVIVDSIQTVYRPEFENAPGTVTQIRECASYLMQFAKAKGFALFIIGHVTKEGVIAGPKILEHIVDTVLQFEGEGNHSYRILRAQKNRFGKSNEIGVFEMHDSGLTEVKNPSELFLSERGNEISGSVVTASMEGTRPVLFEVQALVTPSHFGNPQRVATGFDYRRLSILLAVLEKRANVRVSTHNVFLNMAGGLKVYEPAIDLAACIAIASSLSNLPVRNKLLVVGEVGLGGEIRSVGHIESRLKESEKLGFEEIIIPSANFKSLNKIKGLKIHAVASLAEAITIALR